MLTVLSNRVGDAAILIGIALIFRLGGWRFIFYTEAGVSGLLAGFVILAAITKRAQIPFSA